MVCLNNQQVPMERCHVIGRAIWLEVPRGARIRMCDRMVLEKSAQVGHDFRRAVFAVDANYRISEIRITMRTSAARE